MVADTTRMATGINYKNPPSLDESTTYSQWKNEVKMWVMVTDLDKKKQALALALSLKGKQREVALEIDPSKLNVDAGVTFLISELDKLFEKDKVDETYSAYTDFDKYQRESNKNMSEYIINFEQKYNKCKKYEITLPDTVLAFKLLDNAGLSQNNRQLALTACSYLRFNTMKAALKCIFSTNSSLLESGTASAITVKEESAFVTERHWDKNKKFHQYKGEIYSNSGKITYPKMNPTINGRVSRCRICESKYHWVRDCPHKQ